MKYEELVDQLTPELLSSFRRALETGRWPDGRAMTPEQREHCMQAVIAYEQRHMAERDRVGFVDKGRKAGQQCDDEPEPMRWSTGGEGDS